MTPDLPVDTLDGLVRASARHHAGRPAVSERRRALTYGELDALIDEVAAGLLALGLPAWARVGVYLPKQIETVAALFGAARAGGVFVPLNPVLKARQVAHILADCTVHVLVTSRQRWEGLRAADALPATLAHVVLVDHDDVPGTLAWADLRRGGGQTFPSTAEGMVSLSASTDGADGVAAILYTSGSTGRPKGVVLSHRNLLTGALSVATYLGNTAEDRLLAVLPLSFDYGLSQLTTAFLVGAEVVLLDYLLAADVPRAVERHRITGLAGVPPLWTQLADAPWSEAARNSLRYFTNSGGRMPRPLLDRLRALFPGARPFLMYGLTEAFRSTYLDPALVDTRPESIGKAIPFAEVLVVRADGSEAAPDEPGELVHTGPLVAQGYWGDPERTAQRFRPAPACARLAAPGEPAVWSGDTVRRDADGFLYFVGRLDEMIKTSGYRVSPTEVEEALYASGLVREAAAYGIADDRLGQAIVVAAVPAAGDVVAAVPSDDGSGPTDALLGYCRRELPAYMVPQQVIWRDDLPRNANGKLDRVAIAAGHPAAPAPTSAGDPE